MLTILSDCKQNLNKLCYLWAKKSIVEHHDIWLQNYNSHYFKVAIIFSFWLKYQTRK